MAISVHAVGTLATGTTSITITSPTWTFRNGDVLIFLLSNKYPTNRPASDIWMPAALANSEGTGGAGSAGIDLGTVYSTVRVYPCRGNESGSTWTLAVTSGNTVCGVALVIRPTTEGALFDLACANGADNSGGATSWSVTMGADPGLAANDLVVILSAINTDNYTYNAQAISATGCTFGTVTEQLDSGTSGGQDCGIYVASAPVSTGPSSAAAVYTMTASSSATNNPAGAATLIRIREIANPVTWLSRATGNAEGTTSLTLPNHTSVLSGDLLIAAAAVKYVDPTTPTNYTLDANGHHEGGVGTTGLDTGLVRAFAYYKTADGSENSGNLTVTITSGNSSSGQIFAWRPPANYTWALTFSKGSDNTGGVAYSAAGDADLTLAAGDIVFCIVALNQDLDVKDYAISCSGVTFSSAAFLGIQKTGNGDDSAFFACRFYVLSGTSAGVPTLTATLVSAGANAAGPTVFVRLRAVAPVTDTQEWFGRLPQEKSRSPQWSSY